MTEYSIKTTDFFEQVYQVCELIPEGRVTSYGAIAKYLGVTRSSRMVGWAMNGSHRRAGVPAHRVVNRIGLLTGKVHFGSPTAMQQLLESEGIEVKNDQVMAFKKLFWDPTEELAL
ncbi:MAG: MGMT family protein [Flavobacteriales bacterium]|nr:MGMT family protein [Flavobacteriales bacterium]